ncbi:MAG TPA: hypothetical protein VLF89_09920 [Candidatus Saccharimonadales bacterium]|nr:hypothetical protein [Candidatus Saccharimonadales bacterium]
MNTPTDAHKKLNAAFELLQGPALSYSTFHNVHILIKGLHPDIDKKLESCSKALIFIEKLQEGDVINLAAENLPEESEKEKKRKKALLFFVSNIKDLKNEIQRVDQQLSQTNGSTANNAWHIGQIITYAKGPVGIVTVAAVAIVVILTFVNKPAPSNKSIQVITYKGHQIPLTQFVVGHGPDCDSPHYHAPNEATVTSLDGTILKDPGSCGFGKVKDTQVTTVQQ